MRLLEYQNKINELMSAFVAQIKGATAMRRTDIKLVSETILIPVLGEVYGFKNLRNLNYSEDNYPGIDLGDDKAKVAIQVTSTANIEKIKDTLQKFLDFNLNEKYDRVIIYILTEKQKSYSKSALSAIVKDKFSFDPKKDILDYTDILGEVSFFDVKKTKSILDILDVNFKLPGLKSDLRSSFQHENLTEDVHLNLLELFFPDTLYIAELAFDAPKNPSQDKRGRGRNKFETKRNKVRQALTELGLKFAVDWECYENSLITFHDLSDSTIPLSKIIDMGTVTPLSPDEFYGLNEDQERVFKSLLRRCLQQKLYQRQVVWQNEENMFIFSADVGQDVRKESWVGKKESDRTVYEVTRKQDNSIWYIKHFAFQTQFLSFGEKWYLLMKPEWFFSSDGYKENYYSFEKVDWLKKQEKNVHVYNHFRFLVHFLKHDEPSTLFKQVKPYQFLSFGDPVIFSTAPELVDVEWNPPKETSEETQDDEQTNFFDL